MIRTKKNRQLPIPEIPLFLEELLESRSHFLDAFLESKRRVREFFKSRKNRQTVSRFRILHNQYTEIQKDLQEEARDLSQRKTLVQLTEMAAEKGFDSELVVLGYVMLTDAFKDILNHFPGVKKMIRSGVYTREMNAELSEFAEVTRESIAHHIEQIKTLLKPEAGSCLDEVASMLIGIDDDFQLLAMHDPSLEDSLIIAAMEGRRDSGDLSPAGILELENYIRSLKKESADILILKNKDEDRLVNVSQHIKEPVLEIITNDDGADSGDFFTHILCVVQSRKYEDMVLGIKWAPDPVEDLLAYEITDESNLDLLIVCPEFWFVALMSILFETNGITEDGSLREWALHLLVDAVQRPTKLTRLKVVQEAQKTRSSLAKRIAPFFKGCQSNSARDLVDISKLEQMSSVEVLSIFSVLLATPLDHYTQEERQLSPLQRKIAGDFWLNEIGPRSEEFLLRLVFDTRRALKDGPKSVFGVLRDEYSDIVLEEHTKTLAEKPKEEPRQLDNWHYVSNPANMHTSVDAIIFTDKDPGKTLEQYFRTKKIKPTVKPASIVSALEHFINMPEQLRAVMPHEQIENESWHKIKRGKLRILAKLEDNNRLFFHIYPRKDWVHR